MGLHPSKACSGKYQVMLGGAHITPPVKANKEFSKWRLARSKGRIDNHHPTIFGEKPSRCSKKPLGRRIINMMQNSACKDDVETLT